jgi:hypothetical protein
LPKTSTVFRNKMREERFRKVKFLTDQLRLVRLDLERLEKVLAEIQILETKIYGNLSNE